MSQIADGPYPPHRVKVQANEIATVYWVLDDHDQIVAGPYLHQESAQWVCDSLNSVGG